MRRFTRASLPSYWQSGEVYRLIKDSIIISNGIGKYLSKPKSRKKRPNAKVFDFEGMGLTMNIAQRLLSVFENF